MASIGGSGVTCWAVVAILLGFCLVHNTSATHREHQEMCKRHLVLHRLAYRNCQPKEILTFACRGTCRSYSTVSRLGGDVERTCMCCQPTASVKRLLRLECPDPDQPGHMRFVQLPVLVPQDCSCRPCSEGPH